MKMDFAATINIFGVDTKGWMEFSQVKEIEPPYTPHGLMRFVDVEGQIWEGMVHEGKMSGFTFKCAVVSSFSDPYNSCII